MNKLWTKKQHFVPRMILKHHTYFRIPMRKPIIYQYDKEKGICRTVDIYDICRKDNLYEFSFNHFSDCLKLGSIFFIKL